MATGDDCVRKWWREVGTIEVRTGLDGVVC